MAVNDIYDTSLVFLQDGREWVVGIYYRVSVDDPALSESAIAQLIADGWPSAWYLGAMQSAIPDSISLVSVFCRRIWPTGGIEAINNTGGIAGTNSEESLPAHTCALFKQYGSDAGRNYQGRMYWSGLPRLYVYAGAIDVAGELSLANNIASRFGPQTWAVAAPLVVKSVNYSKKLASDIPPDPKPWSDIDSIHTQPQIATQRGRTLTTTEFSTRP